mmetsp:Transcript_38677/g.93692  ORF Transcript_38677/g.93692 Transcript_38677/m.93692 type:complete len:147 (+) Transcript_38677:757-1197(+)
MVRPVQSVASLTPVLSLNTVASIHTLTSNKRKLVPSECTSATRCKNKCTAQHRTRLLPSAMIKEPTSLPTNMFTHESGESKRNGASIMLDLAGDGDGDGEPVPLALALASHSPLPTPRPTHSLAGNHSVRKYCGWAGWGWGDSLVQ